MGTTHNHKHQITSTGTRLILTMGLNFLITVAEIIGGIFSGSLSLISDALHNFSDGISVILSYIALKLKSRESTFKHTFGLKRAEILAAVINSSVLIIISAYLFYEAAIRFINPELVKSQIMMAVAFIGLLANITGTLLLKRDSTGSLNIKSAYLHLLSDAVSSIAVLLGGAAIYFWNIYFVDPLLTILIGIYIIRESIVLLGKAVHVLMEGAPDEISPEKIKLAVEKIEKVEDIHHLHIWTVGENDIHLEAHINIQDMMTSESDLLRNKIEMMLKSDFGISHITIQFECDFCDSSNLIYNHK